MFRASYSPRSLAMLPYSEMDQKKSHHHTPWLVYISEFCGTVIAHLSISAGRTSPVGLVPLVPRRKMKIFELSVEVPVKNRLSLIIVDS